MRNVKIFAAAMIAAVFIGASSGCAVFEKCSPENCSTDAQINKEAGELLNQHRELGPPGTVRVQTVNGVVYMTGQVDSDFEIRNAEALVRQIANVKDVSNNLYPRSNGR